MFSQLLSGFINCYQLSSPFGHNMVTI